MSDKKQSSVEWLVEKIQQANPSFKFDGLIRQAKAMEEQQMFEFWNGGIKCTEKGGKSFEQYYNETFGDNTP